MSTNQDSNNTFISGLTGNNSQAGQSSKVTTYEFILPDGKTHKFDIPVDLVTLTFIPPETDVQDWMQLEYNRCRNCTLAEESSPLCPVARNIAPLIEWCSRLGTQNEVHIRVIDPQRTVSANTSLQRGISSILGLIMATSPCPHTAFLRPMAHFHLPLADHEETVYRSTSMYLLTQYYHQKDGKNADFSLQELTAKYANLQVINAAMAGRLRQAGMEDMAANALALLDMYAREVPVSIDDELEDLRYIFEHRE